MKIAIIGGGAAGFFAAIELKKNYPNGDVTIFEKKSKFLTKVKVSGGGRCNFTHNSASISELCKNYPRGGSRLKKVFSQFSHIDALKWFENNGVDYVIDEEDCVFPASQNSQTIIDLFLKKTKQSGVELLSSTPVLAVNALEDGFELILEDEKRLFDYVIVTVGGKADAKFYSFLQNLNHTIVRAVPALFSFEIADANLKSLMGVSVENVLCRIKQTKFSAQGIVLVTHWGLSGPAILKLSSLAANYLNEQLYKFELSMAWIGQVNENLIMEKIVQISENERLKNIGNTPLENLPERLWIYLLKKSNIDPNAKWMSLSKRQLNLLVSNVCDYKIDVLARSRTTQEYVCAGGVSIAEVDFLTMESKVHKGLYFAGEVLDVDGFTGGYNLQNAWSTAYVAAQLSKKEE